jgi:hypothetical protein
MSTLDLDPSDATRTAQRLRDMARVVEGRPGELTTLWNQWKEDLVVTAEGLERFAAFPFRLADVDEEVVAVRDAAPAAAQVVADAGSSAEDLNGFMRLVRKLRHEMDRVSTSRPLPPRPSGSE